MPSLPLFVGLLTFVFSNPVAAQETTGDSDYEHVTIGTREFRWGPENDPVRARVLVEEAVLGTAGAEVVEVYFPPGYESRSHFHELEIIYVIEGKLEHIVAGESHVLEPGMVGIVRFPDQVVHKTPVETGALVLVVWPLGNEVKGFEGMTEMPIEKDRGP